MPYTITQKFGDILAQISEYVRSIIVKDVKMHFLWIAQHYKYTINGTFKENIFNAFLMHKKCYALKIDFFSNSSK